MDQGAVYINQDGIIEIRVVGDQTIESVQQLGDTSLQLAAKQRSEGKRPLILDNLLDIGNVPAEARTLVVELVKSDEYDKLAMVGNNPMIRFGANLMLQATGRGSRVKYFDSLAEATEWLLEDNGTE